jgi:tyrosyl-tRNA synthetase
VLLQLTLLPLGEIAGVLEEHRAAPEKRLAQRRVAEWMTELVHGAEAADRSAVAAQSFTAAAAGLSEADLVALADQIPTTHVPSARLVGMDLVELVVELGLVASKSEARRLLAQAGLYVNDEPQSATRPIAAGDLLHGRYLLVRKGKRQRHLVVVDG